MSNQYLLHIDNLSCGGCVGRAERAVQPIPGVAEFTVNLATHQAELVLDDPHAYAEVMGRLAAAGYPAVDPPEDPVAEDQRLHQQLGRRWKQAALISAPLVLIEMTRHLAPGLPLIPERWEAAWQTLQFLLALTVLAGPARFLIRDGALALKRFSPDMNALVLLGAASAFFFSTGVWWMQQPYGLYFEASAVICTLVLLGRWLEQGAKSRTGNAIRSLLALTPDWVRVERDNAWQRVPLNSLQAGDRIRVLPGESLAADGILETPGWLDESLLTGESKHQGREVGDPVVGGSLNAGTGELIFQATATGQETALAAIIAMVARAQGAQLPVQALINRVTYYFVPAVLVLAVATFLAWLFLAGFETAMVNAVSVLIIACPCAMGLATPTSITVGMGRAAASGILFRRGQALEQLSHIRNVAFDKTGTLTLGQPTLRHIEACEGFDVEHIRQIAAGLEQGSNHPIARTLQNNYPAPFQTLEQITGEGMQGIDAQGQGWRLGNIAWITQYAGAPPAGLPTSTSSTLVGLACEGRWAGWFQVSDAIRPNAPAAVADLKAMGLNVGMISGDRSEVANAVAAELGIAEVHAELNPGQKLQSLKQFDGGVAFVGDGINDAPALAAADIGIAIGSGTDVAVESADLVLMNSDPQAVATAVRLSRLTLRNIRQNLGWAFGYNILLIPVAMGLWGVTLSPMLAAGAMALSSFCVVMNALRLRWS